MAHDMVDLFLFQDAFVSDSGQRLREKLLQIKADDASVGNTLSRLRADRMLHVKAIDRVIDEQIDNAVAANIKVAGGGAMVFDAVMAVLNARLNIERSGMCKHSGNLKKAELLPIPLQP